MFDRLGEGISNASGGKGASGGITFNVSAIDSESFGSFLESRGGRALRPVSYTHLLLQEVAIYQR